MKSIIVLISGRGSNLGAILRAGLQAQVAAVISNRPDAAGLALARAADIATAVLDHREFDSREAFDAALAERIDTHVPALVVLAGFMRVLTAGFVDRYRGRMINIHPSLLPKYPGLHTHERAIAAGDATHGASVHFVTAQLDGGPVIAQARIPVLGGDTPDTLAARLLPLENRLLAASVDAIARRRIALGDNGVEFDGHLLVAPLRLQADGGLRAVG